MVELFPDLVSFDVGIAPMERPEGSAPSVSVPICELPERGVLIEHVIWDGIPAPVPFRVQRELGPVPPSIRLRKRRLVQLWLWFRFHRRLETHLMVTQLCTTLSRWL